MQCPGSRKRGGLWGDPELFSKDLGPRGQGLQKLQIRSQSWAGHGARERQRPPLERLEVATTLCPQTQLQRNRIIFLPTQLIFFCVSILAKWRKLNLVLSSGRHGVRVWGKYLLVHPSSGPTLRCWSMEAAAGRPRTPVHTRGSLLLLCNKEQWDREKAASGPNFQDGPPDLSEVAGSPNGCSIENPGTGVAFELCHPLSHGSSPYPSPGQGTVHQPSSPAS